MILFKIAFGIGPGENGIFPCSLVDSSSVARDRKASQRASATNQRARLH